MPYIFNNICGLNQKPTILKFIKKESDQKALAGLSVTNHITASFFCIDMLAGSVELS